MIDIFMLVMVIALAVIIIIINIYLLAYYCAEDDNEFGSGTFAKIIAVLGMFIGLGQVCLLPLDVSNTRGDGGEFRMDIIWKITYILIVIFVFFIIPLAISIYECDPDWSFCQKISNSFCFFACEIVVVACLFGVTYLLWNKAHIPISSLKCSMNNVDTWASSSQEIDDTNEEKFLILCDKKKNTEIEIKVSFAVYIIALLSIISYVLFMIFGGVGIFSFPLDLIYSFCTRPIKIKPAKLEEMKKEIVVTAADLKDLGMQLKKLEEKGDHKRNMFSKEKRHYNELLKELKVGVSVIDDQFQIINMQTLANQTSALGYLLQLIAGVFCFILSFLWIIQILLYIIIKKNGRPINGFLNVPLVKLTDANLSFVAICIFTVLSLYLLLITIKGNFKFGIRIMILGEIHPMKKDNTYMNSILFNVMLVMITSVSVIQFSIRAFGEYTSLTDADIIFNTQIKYLSFYGFFFKNNIFEFGLLIISVISFIYLICRPNDTNTVRKILYKKFENDKKDKENSNKEIEMTVKSINSD